MELPGSFLKAMQSLLGEEYPAFLESRSRPAVRGLRRNPLKCGEQLLRESLPFPIEPTPFSPLSFTFQAGEEGVGKLPAHHAGLFYVQEPSACSAVTVLDPQPGERVLDLCAAPGGKSTQIAGLLEGLRFVEKQGVQSIGSHERALTVQMGESLAQLPGVEVFRSKDPSQQAGVLSFRVSGMDCEELGEALGRRDIALRSGLHCAPLAHRTAGTLETGTVRASVSAFNVPQEIPRFVRELRQILTEKP